MAERITVTVRLSPDSRRGWERAALRGGVTLTALVEAIGMTLLDQDGTVTNAAVLTLARMIDQERRNRR